VIGGGYFVLGGALTALAIVVLSGLIYLERALPRDRTASLTVETTKVRATDDDLRGAILRAGYKITLASLEVRDVRRLHCAMCAGCIGR
jgi:hypothetical protein